MRLADLRLGVIGSRTAHFDQNVWVAAGLGRLIEVWANRCRHVTVALSSAPHRIAYHDMSLTVPRADCLELPFLPSISRGFHKVLGCHKVIREVERRSDAVIVQLPFTATLALLRPRRPRLYHLCADVAGMASASNRYSGYRRVPALLAGNTFDFVQHRLVHAPATRVITNGEELRAHYHWPPGRAVVSTTIRDSEVMSVPRRRPPSSPFRVLFVGYLRLAKGIDTLFDAFDQVLDRIPDAELSIIGPDSIINQGEGELLKRHLPKLEAKGTVRRLGHVNFGPELFQHYADADVLVLPSRSEGTPRVLVEARAFGCPVIATSVGGIPTSITHDVDGLMIQPDDPTALCNAILRVATDRMLRERLIAGGIERARASTIEAFAGAILEEVQLLVADMALPRDAS